VDGIAGLTARGKAARHCREQSGPLTRGHPECTLPLPDNRSDSPPQL
jgi:hypothetical protein